MLNRYQTIGLFSTLSILSIAPGAFADQSSYQRVSGATSAAGSNATSLSHTEQSAYQSGGGTQQLWQSVEAGTLADGQGTTAITDVDMSASQDSIEMWAEDHTQQILQRAGISNAALGEDSTAQSNTEQNATQIRVGF